MVSGGGDAVTCRDCKTPLPERQPGVGGAPRRLCDECRVAAQLRCQKRWYEKNRLRANAMSRAWQSRNRAKCVEYHKRARERGHVPPSRNRVRATLYVRARREALRLGVNVKEHWFRWLSGSLPA